MAEAQHSTTFHDRAALRLHLRLGGPAMSRPPCPAPFRSALQVGLGLLLLAVLVAGCGTSGSGTSGSAAPTGSSSRQSPTTPGSAPDHVVRIGVIAPLDGGLT